MKRRYRFRGAAIAALVLLCGTGTSRGDFLTTLTVQPTPAGGLYHYQYTLTNTAASDRPASLFTLDVAAGSALQSISNTVGWDVTYAPGATSVIWSSAFLPTGATNDLAPGTFGIFSFVSVYTPSLQAFSIFGFDGTPFGGVTNDGTVLSPGIVPEPAGLLLFALGAAVIVGGRTILARYTG